MTKPILPACSVRDCKQAAGAIINGALFCGEHAVEVMESLGKVPKGNSDKKSPHA